MAVGEPFVFSSEAHGSQRRYTGEPYIIHTVSVASILAGMEMDRETIIAALLHDVLEDTSFTGEQPKERFGEDVVTLVDGVTTLGKLQCQSVEEHQADNLGKLFVGTITSRQIQIDQAAKTSYRIQQQLKQYRVVIKDKTLDGQISELFFLFQPQQHISEHFRIGIFVFHHRVFEHPARRRIKSADIAVCDKNFDGADADGELSQLQAVIQPQVCLFQILLFQTGAFQNNLFCARVVVAERVS